MINWHSVFFLLFAALACGFALAVVFTSNVVRMALFLIVSLGATAGLFFLAGADFVGAMQLMIYVGGTLVLLVFGVMLTAQGPFISMRTDGSQWVLASAVGAVLLAILLPVAFSVEPWRNAAQPGEKANVTVGEIDPTATSLGMALLGARVDADSAPGATEAPSPADPAGNASGERSPGVLSGYLLPFEIISVHLLVVLIGAAYLARAKKRVRVRET